MKHARTPLIGLLALGAALTMPLAFAQTEPTAQDPTAQPQATQSSDMAGQAQPTEQAAPSAGKQMTWADVDADGNGTISKTESANLPSLAQVFDQADADKDGELTADEYKAFVAQNSAPAAGGEG